VTCNIFYADTLCHAMSLIFDPVDLEYLCYIMYYVIEVTTMSERNRAISG